ncbi:MAG: DUF6443 domain-containing protein [Bacteroidota bacterium]
MNCLKHNCTRYPYARLFLFGWLFSLWGMAGLYAQTCFLESGGEVVIEAENYSAQQTGSGNASGSSWTSISDGASSGGTALQATPNTGVYTGLNLNGPRLDYEVYFSTPGTYEVWVRAQGGSSTDDSFHAGIDGQGLTNLSGWGLNVNGPWGWTRWANAGDPVTFTVSNAGQHTFNLWMREDGVEIDKIVLTSIGTYPSGTGPAVSSTGSCGSGGSGGGGGGGNSTPPAGQKVLFVVGNPSLNASDLAFKDMLETDLGYEVTVANDDGISESASDGHDLILISSTVNSGKVGNTFNNTPIPLGTWERGLFDNLGIVASNAQNQTDYGLSAGGSIDFINPSDGMSGGASGNVQMFNSSTDMAWAIPNANATIIAMKPGQSEVHYFRYDAGVQMYDGKIAPATRFILPLSNNAAVNLTSLGLDLLKEGIEFILPPFEPFIPQLEGPVCFLQEPNSDQNFTGITLADGSSVVIGTSNASPRVHHQYQHILGASNSYFTIDTIKGAPHDTVICRVLNVPGSSPNYQFVDCQTIDLSQYTITSTTSQVIRDYDIIASRIAADGTVLWSKTFGSFGFDWFSSNLGTNLTVGSDGNLLMAMSRSAVYTQPLRPLLVKVDVATGDVIWSKYDTSLMGDDRIKSLFKTSDDHLITTGPSFAGVWNCHLQKLDENTGFVTGKFYQVPGASGLQTRGDQVLEGGDGSYLLNANHYTSTYSNYTSLLINTANDGNTVNWAKQITHSNPAFLDQCKMAFSHVQAHPEGGYVGIGFSECDVAQKEMLMARIDADGNLIWMQSYGHPTEALVGLRVAVLGGGDLAVVGHSDSENFVARISESNGALVWAHGFSPTSEGVSFSIEVLSFDRIFVIGRTIHSGAIVSQFGADGMPTTAYGCQINDLTPQLVISDVQAVLADRSIGIYNMSPYQYNPVQMFEHIEDKGVSNKEVCPGFISECDNAPFKAATPTLGTNHIISRTPRIPVNSIDEILTNGSAMARDMHETVAYYNRLGWETEKVLVNASPNLDDIISFQAYDGLGRTTRQYLPFNDAGPKGSLRLGTPNVDNIYSPPVVAQANFYDNDVYPQMGGLDSDKGFPFAEVDMEFSPLGRVFEQGAPGSSWQLGAATSKSDYLAWDSPDIPASLELLYYGVNPESEANKIASHFQAGDVYVSRAEDENGSVSFTFVDKLGRTLMTSVMVSGTDPLTATYASTLNLYDQWGNVRFVIQPQGYEELKTNPKLAEDILNRWAFQYVYDERLRLIEKKVPGAGWVHMVYNRLNQIVMTQDANQRELSVNNKLHPEWQYTKYDGLGRPIITGIYQATDANLDSREELQAKVNDETNLFESRSSSGIDDFNGTTFYGYTNVAFPPLSEGTVLSMTYFDDYDYDFDGTPDVSFVPEVECPNAEPNLRTQGMITGIRTGVLGLQEQFLLTATFYDSYGRELQSQAENLLGGIDISTSKTNFVGETQKTIRRHATTANQVTMINRFCYDHFGRLIRTTQQTDENPEEVLAELRYNVLGQLEEKDLLTTSGTALQSIDYLYNVRGWMTDINKVDPVVHPTPVLAADNDLFSMRLHYNTSVDGTPVSNFNGSITGVEWQNGFQSQISSNTYTYDRMYRLLTADYQVKTPASGGWTDPASDFNSSYSYDLNGNLMSLTRQGPNAQNLIDDLTYNYGTIKSNQLVSVTDAAVPTPGLIEFVDGNSGTDYEYDENGNLIKDLNKGNEMQYNHLNKVREVSITSGPDDGGTLTYLYGADGNKLRQIMERADGTIESRDYIQGFQYITNSNGTQLEFITHTEGRLVPDGSGGYEYQVHLTDHQGNVRAVVGRDANGDADLLETKDYYAFGMEMATEGATNTTPQNRFTYNGKELISEFGIRWADYGARWYDASIGRWNGVDAFAERYTNKSPYTYVLNNPISLVDPNGKEVVTYDATAAMIVNAFNSVGKDGKATFQGNSEPYTPSTTTSDPSSAPDKEPDAEGYSAEFSVAVEAGGALVNVTVGVQIVRFNRGPNKGEAFLFYYISGGWGTNFNIIEQADNLLLDNAKKRLSNLLDTKSLFLPEASLDISVNWFSANFSGPESELSPETWKGEGEFKSVEILTVGIFHASIGGSGTEFSGDGGRWKGVSKNITIGATTNWFDLSFGQPSAGVSFTSEGFPGYDDTFEWLEKASNFLLRDRSPKYKPLPHGFNPSPKEDVERRKKRRRRN